MAYGLGDRNAPVDKEGFRSFYRDFRQEFSNIRINVEEVISQDDYETSRVKVKALHNASGKEVEFTGQVMTCIKDNKIVEAWNHINFLQMYQQLGQKLVPQ